MRGMEPAPKVSNRARWTSDVGRRLVNMAWAWRWRSECGGGISSRKADARTGKCRARILVFVPYELSSHVTLTRRNVHGCVYHANNSVSSGFPTVQITA